MPDLDFLFHMFFLARYCKLLEENSFRGRTADFFYMLLFGASVLTGIVLIGGMIPYVSASFAKIIFLSNSLTFMMVSYSCFFFAHIYRLFIGFGYCAMNFFFQLLCNICFASLVTCFFCCTGLCVEQAKSFYPYEFLGPLYLYSSLSPMGK